MCQAAKAALVNFYETLRFEVNDEVGITIATHGWIGGEMTRGKFMVEERAEMQWKEEREVSNSLISCNILTNCSCILNTHPSMLFNINFSIFT